MKKYSITIFFLIFFHTLCAQPYWQQQVNYAIAVTLDDANHMLKAEVTIEYLNNSPYPLEELYIHFWPNAYSSRQTPFARQKLENNDLAFHFSAREDRGFMDEINFTSGNRELSLHFTDESREIGRLQLSRPLAPGESFTFHTPFRVKIPKVYSRMGHDGQAYYISQWFPKVAMYDHEGWHPMPYLDQGEFYSNFGNYRVSITLPRNYLVTGTGEIQEEEELEWLDQQVERGRERLQNPSRLAEEEMETPPSDPEMKTVTFVQENVHDFAWFADKRYLVLKDEITLPSGRTVESWAFFTPNLARSWQYSLDYLRNSTLHFSELVGEYPWSTVKAVSGSLDAGGGMEYPTVTIIAVEFQLERIILHEVGHNWFYGIIASNEREYPWIDEGITSYYENRYYRDRRTVPLYHPSRSGLRPLLLGNPSRLVYYIQARNRMDQPAQLPATNYSYINYYGIIYGKAAHAMEYLEHYLGQQLFDSVMKVFYQEWQFRHPQPRDFEEFFTNATGRDLSWLFHDLIQTNRRINYAITGNTSRRGEIQLVPLENRGEVSSPVHMQVVWRDGTVSWYWFEGFEGERQMEIPAREYERIVINPVHIVPDVFQEVNAVEPGFLNNRYGFRFGFDLERVGKRQTLIMPAPGFNLYDGFMFGPAFYNTFLPPQTIQYAIIPVFATGSGRIAGSAEVRYNIFRNPADNWSHWNIGVAARRFSYNIYEDQPLRYSRVSPYIQYEFKPAIRSNITHMLTLRNILASRDILEFTPAGEFTIKPDNYYLNELKYNYDNTFILFPSRLQATIQQAEGLVKLFAETEMRFKYNERRNSIDFRLFGGAFVLGDDPVGRYGYRLSSRTGRFDYTYDHWFFDRSTSAYRSFWAQQIVIDDGGFKTSTNHTNTDEWIFAANIMAQPPWRLPARAYGSMGFFGGQGQVLEENQAFSWESGIAVTFARDIAELYLPVFVSPDIRKVRDLNVGTGSLNQYLRSITWMINFKKLHPFKVSREIDRFLQ